jgi:hypothetical protein
METRHLVLGFLLSLYLAVQLGEAFNSRTGYMYIEDCPDIPTNKRDITLGLKLRHLRSLRMVEEGHRTMEDHERSFPSFVSDSFCSGTQVQGSFRGGMILIESVEFEYNSRVPDFITKRSDDDEREFDFANPHGNGQGLIENLIGAIGFSSVRITKFPDKSSRRLSQEAARNDGHFCMFTNC